MRRGFTLAELVVTVAIMCVVTAVTLPRLRGLQDWIAVDTAAREVTTALAAARHAAVTRAAKTRLLIARDSLRIDLSGLTGWTLFARWPGPAHHTVELEVSNPEVAFGPTGTGWGASNTSVVLRRGRHTETITVSRVGRVKRW